MMQDDPSNTLTTALGYLLRFCDVQVTHETLKERVLSHPYYPNHTILCDLLSEWGITAKLARCNDIENLTHLTLPLLAQRRTPVGSFVVVQQITAGKVRMIDLARGWTSATWEELRRELTGLVLLLSGTDKPRSEEKYAKKRRRELFRNSLRHIAWVTAVTVLLALILLTSFRISERPDLLPILFTKLLGLMFTLPLVAYHFPNGEPVLRKTCGRHERLDCSHVLQSDAAKIGGALYVSDVGMLYFFTGILYIFLGSLSGHLAALLWALAVLSMVALPYTVFSLLYQAIRLRRWCSLCVGVQVLLWIEPFLLVKHLWSGIPAMSTETVGIALIGAGAPASIWVLVSRSLRAVKECNDWRFGYRRLVSNPVVVEAQLRRAPVVSLPEVTLEPCLGPAAAPIKMTLVLSPYCRLCKEQLRQLRQLMTRFPRQLAVCLRFVCPPDRRDPGWRRAYRVLGLFSADQPGSALSLLVTPSSRWQRARGEALPRCEAAEDHLHKQAVWKKETPIGLPVLLLNGTLVPQFLEARDLYWYVSGLLVESPQTSG